MRPVSDLLSEPLAFSRPASIRELFGRALLVLWRPRSLVLALAAITCLPGTVITFGGYRAYLLSSGFAIAQYRHGANGLWRLAIAAERFRPDQPHVNPIALFLEIVLFWLVLATWVVLIEQPAGRFSSAIHSLVQVLRERWRDLLIVAAIGGVLYAIIFGYVISHSGGAQAHAAPLEPYSLVFFLGVLIIFAPVIGFLGGLFIAPEFAFIQCFSFGRSWSKAFHIALRAQFTLRAALFFGTFAVAGVVLEELWRFLAALVLISTQSATAGTAVNYVLAAAMSAYFSSLLVLYALDIGRRAEPAPAS